MTSIFLNKNRRIKDRTFVYLQNLKTKRKKKLDGLFSNGPGHQ